MKRTLTLHEFYEWRWVLREKRKMEAGDKTAFRPSPEEQVKAWKKRKGMS